MPIRVLHIGLGPIGAAVVRQVAARPGFKAVGAVTEAEAKDLAEQFKLESEEFDAMRKKLSLAVRKRMKG